MSHTTQVDWREYYDREGETKKFLPGLDQAETLRVAFVQRLVSSISFSSALDVGCGNGYLASQLAEWGAGDVAGVDFSRPRLRDGRAQFQSIRFSRASATALPFRANHFELVSMVEVLEHLPEPEAALRELARVARKFVVVTVPYRGKILEITCPHCMKTHHFDGHIHSFDEDKLGGMARAAGLDVIRLETYSPYYPPRNPLLRRVPAVRRLLRSALVRAGLKSAQPPKYLGLLARVS